jgi:hypothetical protein
VTLPRRRPRAVYRVYSEEQYLAGADSFGDLEAVVAQPTSAVSESSVWPERSSRERRLRRLAGAAALTGAVGTVLATIAVFGLRSHPAKPPDLAANLSGSARAKPPDSRRVDIAHPDISAKLARNARDRETINGELSSPRGSSFRHLSHRVSTIADRRRSLEVTTMRTRLAKAQTDPGPPVAFHPPPQAPGAPAAQPRAVRSSQAPATDTAPTAPAQVASTGPRRQAQSEFGFER